MANKEIGWSYKLELDEVIRLINKDYLTNHMYVEINNDCNITKWRIGTEIMAAFQ